MSASTDGIESRCMDPHEHEICEFLYDSGDPDTGVNGAWVCQLCGEVDVNREPPSDDHQ